MLVAWFHGKTHPFFGKWFPFGWWGEGLASSMENSNYKLLFEINDMQNIHFIFHENEFIMGIFECVARGDILYIGNIVGIGFSRVKSFLTHPHRTQSVEIETFMHTFFSPLPMQNTNKLILITLNAKIFSHNWVCYWTAKCFCVWEYVFMTFMRIL